MIDEVRIFVGAGNGGNGSVSFRREKYVPLGGPDGGDGGEGGSVIFVGSASESTLRNFRSGRKHIAEAGANGQGKKRRGHAGEDLRLPVPVGTVVWRESNQGPEEMLGEVVSEGQELVGAIGGGGGKGNVRFANSVNQVPRLAESGEEAQEGWIRLELKLLADVGLIGYPNAGKSTFLQAVTAARPEIGAYPFTTLEPNLGVAWVGWRDIVFADLPGLIEGAHEGRGLGHQFLRHTERTAVLVHLVDGSTEDPVVAWKAINEELHLYSDELAQKPQIVVVNKIDLPEVEGRIADIKAAFDAEKVESFFTCAVIDEGVDEVVLAAARLVTDARDAQAKRAKEAEPPRVVVRPTAEEPLVTRTDEAFLVTFKRAERLAAMVDMDHPEARVQFQRELERMGVMNALEKAGAESGDLIRVGAVEMEWT